MARKRIDLTGQKFNKLTVESITWHNGEAFTHCKCECGGAWNGPARRLKCKSRPTKSCGCLKEETQKIMCQNQATACIRHGMSNTPEHRIWAGMIRRCTYEKDIHNWEHYGAKGIKVCERWLEKDGKGFQNFYKDMGPRPSSKHSIDRKDSTKDYEPDNCRWATNITQKRNRPGFNITAIHNGQTKLIIEWSEELGISYQALRYRWQRYGKLIL